MAVLPRLRTALALGAALACAALPASAQSVLRRGNGAETDSVDPQKSNSVPGWTLARDLFEGLTTLDPGGRVVPGAAGAWTVSADGKTWTFALRPGLAWSNGDPLDARDFVYSLRRLVAPENAFIKAFLVESIVGAKEITAGTEHDPGRLGVAAPDPLTLRITLRAPDPALPQILALLPPVHRASIEALGPDAFKPGNLVSDGAYRLTEWQQMTRMVLERNPHYRDAAHVAIDRVEYYPIEDQDEELKRYRADELDLTASVPHEQLDFIKTNLAAEYRVSPVLGIAYVGFNLERPPFKDDLRLREALSLAVDRQILTEKIVRGGALPAYGWIPPGIEGYPDPQPDWAAETQAERNERARADYRAAGYGPEHPLHVRLRYNSGENGRRLVVAIAGMWRQVLGVETEFQNQEFRTYLTTMRLRQTTEAFSGSFYSYYADPLPLLYILTTGAPLDNEGWSDPAYDALFRAASQTSDRTDRLRCFAQAETRLLAELPVMPLYSRSAEHLIKPTILGWQPSPLDTFRTQDLRISR